MNDNLIEKSNKTNKELVIKYGRFSTIALIVLVIWTIAAYILVTYYIKSQLAVSFLSNIYNLILIINCFCSLKLFDAMYNSMVVAFVVAIVILFSSMILYSVISLAIMIYLIYKSKKLLKQI